MIFFPAIDLMGGQCVRLLRGDMATATVFSDDPASQARAFAAAGCEWVHVVDLDGAFAGAPVNAEAVRAIVAAVDIPVQLGGGIREMVTMEDWLDRGVARVILGTVAATNIQLVRNACSAYPGRIAVGIDARDGKVAVEGWSKVLDVCARELALRLADAGACAIIYTDIGRDGAMAGPNIDATLELARGVSIPVIASGGVSNMDDLRRLKEAGDGILEGVISGRAVYNGRIDPAEAAALLRGSGHQG